jgi:hypothetical protein
VAKWVRARHSLIDRSVGPLGSRGEDLSACSRATFANIQGEFISELHRLEVAVVVQAFALIVCLALVGDVVTPSVADLGYACGTCTG